MPAAAPPPPPDILRSGHVLSNVTFGLNLPQRSVLVVDPGAEIDGLTLEGGGNGDSLQDYGVVSGLVVHSGFSETVESGGLAANTLVYPGGSQFVAAGGTATGTTSHTATAYTVASGQTLNGVTLLDGDTLTVSAGGSASDIVADYGASVVVLGSITGVTVAGGSLTVFGSGSDITLEGDSAAGLAAGAAALEGFESGATGVAYIDGSATGITVSSGGFLHDEAVVANVTVDSGGGAVVSSGYYSPMTVESAVNVTLSGGSLDVTFSGLANGVAVLGGGTLVADTGGVVESTTVGSGGLEILQPGGTLGDGSFQAGGTAFGTTVQSGGEQSDGYYASGTHVQSGGEQIVLGLPPQDPAASAAATTTDPGGTVYNGRYILISSGEVVPNLDLVTGDGVEVLAGGTISDTTISDNPDGDITGASVNVLGTADASTITAGGALEIGSGGVASVTLVQSGGTLVLADDASAFATHVVSGGMEQVNDNSVDTDPTFDAGSVADLVSGALRFDQAGNVTLAATITGSAGRVIQAGTGTLTLTGNSTFAGAVVLSAGTVELATPTAAGGGSLVAGAITFAGPATLKLDETGLNLPTNTISGLAVGDAIDLAGYAYSSNTTATVVPSTVTVLNNTLVIDADGTSTELWLDPTQNFSSATFANSPDATGGTLLTLTGVACYVTGTRILTSAGERTVEDLAEGDLVVTASGEQHPIRWIGRRSYAGRFIAGNHLMLPVTIRAGALAGGVPHSDLVVSPGHALWVDGQLVPAWRLVNGVSVTQAEAVDSVAYFHVELDRHELLLANGAPAESFLDETGFRGQFQNAAEFHALYPDALPLTPLQPRLEDGFALQRMQERVASRAGLCPSAEPAGALRGYVDQAGPERVCGWAQDVDSPEEPVALEISVGGTGVLCVLANAWRADLRTAGIGSGCHAFDVSLPGGWAGPVVVRRVADGAVLGLTEDADQKRAA